jgi:hypothetical protein
LELGPLYLPTQPFSWEGTTSHKQQPIAGRGAKALDDVPIAQLHTLKTSTRAQMLSGARKKDIVVQQKAHIGEVKALI